LLTLSDSRLLAVPEDHYPTIDAARADLEPLLRAWEAHTELQEKSVLRFRLLANVTSGYWQGVEGLIQLVVAQLPVSPPQRNGEFYER
jgi:hypothetical protein